MIDWGHSRPSLKERAVAGSESWDREEVLGQSRCMNGPNVFARMIAAGVALCSARYSGSFFLAWTTVQCYMPRFREQRCSAGPVCTFGLA